MQGVVTIEVSGCSENKSKVSLVSLEATLYQYSGSRQARSITVLSAVAVVAKVVSSTTTSRAETSHMKAQRRGRGCRAIWPKQWPTGQACHTRQGCERAVQVLASMFARIVQRVRPNAHLAKSMTSNWHVSVCGWPQQQLQLRRGHLVVCRLGWHH